VRAGYVLYRPLVYPTDYVRQENVPVVLVREGNMQLVKYWLDVYVYRSRQGIGVLNCILLAFCIRSPPLSSLPDELLMDKRDTNGFFQLKGYVLLVIGPTTRLAHYLL
jgi:hypothetical protein